MSALERSQLAQAAQAVVDVFDADQFVPTDAIERLRAALEDEALLREQVLTVAQLASLWRVSTEHVRKLIEAGRLRAFDSSLGTVPRWRIPARWANEYRDDANADRKSQRDPEAPN